MTGRLLLLALCLAALSSCSRDEVVRDPTVFAEDALSVVPPDGWQVKHQNDTLVFVGGSPGSEAPPVIAIRSVSASSWSEPRTTDSVAPSVKKVLEALPAATVRGPTPVEHPAYRALAFDVTFVPRSKHGKLYQRRHVVIEAHEHVYHAFLTAPEGELTKNLPEFEKVLASLREEV